MVLTCESKLHGFLWMSCTLSALLILLYSIFSNNKLLLKHLIENTNKNSIQLDFCEKHV